MLRQESGLSLTKLERRYIQDTDPERFATMTRKPDAFLRYSKGVQIPKSKTPQSSPVSWASSRYPVFKRWHSSAFFEAMSISEDREELINFTRELWARERIPKEIILKTMRKSELAPRLRHHAPIWGSPSTVVSIRHVVDLDALCLILLALKSNIGMTSERQCLLILAEWLQNWIEHLCPNEELQKMMMHVLVEHVPTLGKLFAEPLSWKTLKVDLTHDCFKSWRLREAAVK